MASASSILERANSSGVLGLDHVVQRLRIAIEHRRHDAMRVLGDGIADSPLQLVRRAAEQAGERAIGGCLPPLSEQMEHEEQGAFQLTSAGLAGQVALDEADQSRRDVVTPRPGRP
jgi:hypothetical protein